MASFLRCATLAVSYGGVQWPKIHLGRVSNRGGVSFRTLGNDGKTKRASGIYCENKGDENHLPTHVPLGMDFEKRSLSVLNKAIAEAEMAVDQLKFATVKVSYASATEINLKPFFSYCGDILSIETKSKPERMAFVTFKNKVAAEIAVALSGATIAGSSVNVTMAPDYTSASTMVAVSVINVPIEVTEEDLKQVFSYAGDILCMETQSDRLGAETAVLLSGTMIAGSSIGVYMALDYMPSAEALTSFEATTDMAPDQALAASSRRKSPVAIEYVSRKAEAVVRKMHGKGYKLGKDALAKAKTVDEQHTSVASIYENYLVAEKVNKARKEFDLAELAVESLESALKNSATALRDSRAMVDRPESGQKDKERLKYVTEMDGIAVAEKIRDEIRIEISRMKESIGVAKPLYLLLHDSPEN